MLKNIKLNNQKSVAFKVRSFAVPSEKSRELKHTIYAANNFGFTARNANLSSGYGSERLRMTTEAGFNSLREITLVQIDSTRIKKIFCFSTHQGGEIVNCILAVTGQGVYYIPLFGGFTPERIPNFSTFTNFDCFAYSYSGDRDFVFASNASGIYVSDYSMAFKPMTTDIRNAKQMIVFDKRLFVLDDDGETIHFANSLDLLSIEGSIRVDSGYGKILSLDVYENKLLIVCANGFKLLEVPYNSSKFRFSNLCRSYEEIIDGSAKVLGDTIFFLSRGGMCKAVRGKISLLDIEIEEAHGDVCGTVYDNKYFLSNGEKMIVIEKFIDSVTVYEGFNVRAFENIFNEYSDRLAILTEENGIIYQIEKGIGSTTRIWESGNFALTYASGNQFVRQVMIKTATDIELTVIGDRAEQRITVKGSPDIQTIKLNLKGDLFRVKIIANGGGIQISSLSVVVGF